MHPNKRHFAAFSLHHPPSSFAQKLEGVFVFSRKIKKKYHNRYSYIPNGATGIAIVAQIVF